MQTFLTGFGGIVLGIIVMHIISELFVRRDEKKRLIKFKKLSIRLNEKCAIALRLYGEQKKMPDSLIDEIEELVLELIDVIPYNDELEENAVSRILFNTLENPVCATDIKQGFAVGRIYSCLKLLYSL